MNRLLLLLCLALIGCNGNDGTYPKSAHFDQVLIGRETAGSNNEKLHGYVTYDSAQLSRYPNAQEWHVVYKDDVPVPAGVEWTQLRANWSAVLIACPWHIDRAEGISAGVGILPGGEDGSVGTAVGGQFFVATGHERVGVWSYVAPGDINTRRIGLRINAPIEMNGETGYTGVLNGARWVGGICMGPVKADVD